VVLHADSITGLLMVDRHLEQAADQLTLAGLAVDGLKAAADQEQAIRAAQLLQDAAHRLRMVAATVAAVQASLGRLTAEDDDDGWGGRRHQPDEPGHHPPPWWPALRPPRGAPGGAAGRPGREW
jgi:hypothetical protein